MELRFAVRCDSKCMPAMKAKWPRRDNCTDECEDEYGYHDEFWSQLALSPEVLLQLPVRFELGGEALTTKSLPI
jgi:hypothetical protein